MYTDAQIDALEKYIGVQFKNRNMLLRAFTHRSYLNEYPEESAHNERLEFLGDAVLELTTTRYLYEHYENREGDLTSWRAALVNTEMLSSVAESLRFNDFLRLSKGEMQNHGKARQQILANALEAFIGACYLDQGYDMTEKFIRTHILRQLPRIIRERSYSDAKSRFQELAQEKTGITPSYQMLEEWGPDHAKMFRIAACIRNRRVGIGEGSSKKTAEQNAADDALRSLAWSVPGDEQAVALMDEASENILQREGEKIAMACQHGFPKPDCPLCSPQLSHEELEKHTMPAVTKEARPSGDATPKEETQGRNESPMTDGLAVIWSPIHRDQPITRVPEGATTVQIKGEFSPDHLTQLTTRCPQLRCVEISKASMDRNKGILEKTLVPLGISFEAKRLRTGRPKNTQVEELTTNSDFLIDENAQASPALVCSMPNESDIAREQKRHSPDIGEASNAALEQMSLRELAALAERALEMLSQRSAAALHELRAEA